MTWSQSLFSCLAGLALYLSLSSMAHASPVYDQIEQWGCEAIQDGYCSRGTYDPNMDYNDLIQRCWDEVAYDSFALILILKWSEALSKAQNFQVKTPFFDGVQTLKNQGQIKSIVYIEPDANYCTDPSLCSYGYFFLYLNDGTVFFFEWNHNTQFSKQAYDIKISSHFF